MKAAKDKNLFELCLPLSLYALLGFTVLMLDTMIIRAYSNQAVAAENQANQVLGIAYEFSALFDVSTAIIINKNLVLDCLNQTRVLEKTTTQANALFSFILSLMVLLFSLIILELINTPADIYSDTLLHLQIGAA